MIFLLRRKIGSAIPEARKGLSGLTCNFKCLPRARRARSGMPATMPISFSHKIYGNSGPRYQRGSTLRYTLYTSYRCIPRTFLWGIKLIGPAIISTSLVVLTSSVSAARSGLPRQRISRLLFTSSILYSVTATYSKSNDTRIQTCEASKTKPGVK